MGKVPPITGKELRTGVTFTIKSKIDFILGNSEHPRRAIVMLTRKYWIVLWLRHGGAYQDTNLFVSNQLTSAGAMCAGLHAHASLRDTDDYAKLRAAQRKLHRLARAQTRKPVMKNCRDISLSDKNSQPLKIRASRLADTVGGSADDEDHVPTGI